jgi:hypothetical protein
MFKTLKLMTTEKIVFFRIGLLIIALLNQLIQQVEDCLAIDGFSGLMWFDECIARNKLVTIQTNYMVCIWLFLAILWGSNPEKLSKIQGNVKSALTVYITITFLVYWIVLSDELGEITKLVKDEDNFVYSFIEHYVVPIAFIVDWVLTERNKLKWKYALTWLIYPVIVLVISIVNGTLGLSKGYLYRFLDLSDGDMAGYITWIFILLGFYIIISLIYITINLKLLTKDHDVIGG